MFEQLEYYVNKNQYIQYLKFLKIDTIEIINNIQLEVEKQKNNFDNFSNRSHRTLSPNILLENIVFQEVNKYLCEKSYGLNIFQRDIELDIKTLIATQNSIIERPKLLKPSETKEGFKINLDNEDDFIRIARFENEMIETSRGSAREGQTIVFEGLSFLKKENPLFAVLPTSLIWNNAFCEPSMQDNQFIVAHIRQFNTIESTNTLWINSLLQYDLYLRLDNFNNGLRALNDNDEIVLKFRQWRSNLISNGNSVGQDSNIAKLEGCDLMLRKDYFDKLKTIIPDVQFYTKIMELKL